MTIAFVFNPDTLGTDIDVAMADVAPVWGLASGLRCVGNAWVRRLSCPPGGLIYDPNYISFDVLSLLNQDLAAADISDAQGKISAAIEDDERCDTCRAALILDRATERLFIVLVGKLVTGRPFQFVMAADKVNIFLLAVDGQQIAGASVIGQAAAAAGVPVQLVVGPPGPPGASTAGPAGPPGPAGEGGLTLDFDESTGADDSGAQRVIYQRLVDFDTMGSSVTLTLLGNVYSASGTAFVKLSYGGTSRNPDGTQVGATVSVGSPTPAAVTTGATISNPTGKKLVKITVQSSGAGVEAGIQDRTVTVK